MLLGELKHEGSGFVFKIKKTFKLSKIQIMQTEGKVHLLENKSQVMYKVKFTFKIPKVHCQKVRNANYTKNLDFDLQMILVNC